MKCKAIKHINLQYKARKEIKPFNLKYKTKAKGVENYSTTNLQQKAIKDTNLY